MKKEAPKLKFHAGPKLIEDGVFKRTKDFFVHGRIYNQLTVRNFCLAINQVDDGLLIDRLSILPNSFIDIDILYLSKVSEERLSKVIEQYPEINIATQLEFFKKLKEELVEKKIGIIDLKFGLDTDFNFKIVKPIDYVDELLENIIFIDSIIEELRNHL